MPRTIARDDWLVVDSPGWGSDRRPLSILVELCGRILLGDGGFQLSSEGPLVIDRRDASFVPGGNDNPYFVTGQGIETQAGRAIVRGSGAEGVLAMTSVVPADLDAVIERKVQGTVFNQSANVTISLVGGRRGQEVVGAFCDWQIVGAQVMDTGRLMPNGELWSSFYTEGDRFAATCTMGNGARTFEVDVDTLMRF